MLETLYKKRLELDPAADAQFVQRWSPRSFVAYDVSDQQVEKIVDAARWAPSCFNEQPWRITISTDKTFEQYLDLLLEGNQVWCKHVSRLGFVIAKKNFTLTDQPNDHARFDCGAAWVSMALQARAMDLHMHAMAGIKTDEVNKHFNIDATKFDVICAFAIGKRKEDASHLPENLQEMEAPNHRKKLDEIYALGQFPFSE